MILCALQGVRDSPREGGRKKRTIPRQSQQPGTKRGGGGFTAAALQTSHHRGRIKWFNTSKASLNDALKHTYQEMDQSCENVNN